MKSSIRVIVRKILGSRQNETISNSISRHKVKFKKYIYKKKISPQEFIDCIQKLGIKKGDHLMVHASWRDCFNLDMTPIEVVETLKNILGDDGTLLMPSYGSVKDYFDLNKTPSAAGVLSETFRTSPNVFRSACTHFSIAAYGKYAKKLTEDHYKSVYGFDEFSPYTKFASVEGSKILFLGLGKKPTQISIFHCSGWMLRDGDKSLYEVYGKKYHSKLVINNQVITKKMITRNKGYENNNKVFKKAFSLLKETNNTKVSNLDMVVINANEALNKAIELNQKGIYFYKNM